MFGDSFITIKDKKTKKTTNNNKMDLIRLWIEFRRRKKKVLMSGKQENK
jgi:hypothetical protein